MEIHEIHIWKKFECQGTKCPDTCCRGWIIPLTPDDRVRYLTSFGRLWPQLLFAMSGRRLGDFNASCGDCPFLNRDKLCKLQLAKGHDFIPETCRSYPRAYRNYGAFEERFIDLSCFRVAQLFIENVDDLSFEIRDGEPESDPYSSNDDETYLNDLVSARRQMGDALRSVSSYEDLGNTLVRIDSYAHDTQEAFIHGHEDYLRTDPFEDHVMSEGWVSVFPLGATAVSYLMNTGLYSEYLKRGSRYIYDIFCMYMNDPQGGYTPARLSRIYADYTAAHPERVRYYAAYYTYYLLKFYMNCYEDYSFVKNVRIGLIHLGMIFFLHAMYYEKKGRLDMDTFTHILSAYNKRAYFNYENLDDMYEVFITQSFGSES